MPLDFKIPGLGENVQTGDVLNVLVKVGDKVKRDQPLMELETGKAVVEVPATAPGTIVAVMVKKGDKVAVGQVAMQVEVEAGYVQPAKSPTTAVNTPVLAAPKPAMPAPKPVATVTASPSTPIPTVPRKVVPAAPSVRRLARELGVSIERVPGTGERGRISQTDVKNFVKQITERTASANGGLAPMQSHAQPLPDFAKWGEVAHEPMSAIRKVTAQHMAHVWSVVPHVTQHDKADISLLEKFRARYAKKAEAAGGKLTVTAVLLKVVAQALNVFPQFASSLDMTTQTLVRKQYRHIGVAVDTEHGLLVPVIRDVDKKNLAQLSAELSAAAAKARSRKTTPDDLQGGVFSITNLGGFGGTGFSPIVNWPEVAILGVARTQIEAVWNPEQSTFEPRPMLPLSLSYDHRVIDGADGIRFLRWVCEALEQPFLTLLEG